MHETLLVRADASPRMGTGHVMRCLALAQAWQPREQVHFLSAEITSALEARLTAEGFVSRSLAATPGSVDDAEVTIACAREHGAAWVVVDGYQFGADYQRLLMAAGFRILFLDDYGHAGEYEADLVLNQNLGADAALYVRRKPHTRLLLGPRYALLRREFQAWRDWTREIPPVARKVLVTLGGGDPDNVTGKVVQALQGLDVECKVVVGGSNPNLEELKSAIGNRRSAMELVVNAANMSELMAWADMAIAAGGSTAWELAFMGLPSLVLVLAENQLKVAEALAASNVARRAGTGAAAPGDLSADLHELLNDRLGRARMSRLGRTMVDGKGGERVVGELTGAAMTLRPAEPKDCRQVWEWANDPEVRAVSFNTEPIPWESHTRWFEARRSDPDCVFLIADNSSGAPIGQVRFDLNNAEAVISVSVDRRARGRGFGSELIRRASQRLHEERQVCVIHAFTKPENAASIRAFERAGYRKVGSTQVGAHPAIELIQRLP